MGLETYHVESGEHDSYEAVVIAARIDGGLPRRLSAAQPGRSHSTAKRRLGVSDHVVAASAGWRSRSCGLIPAGRALADRVRQCLSVEACRSRC